MAKQVKSMKDVPKKVLQIESPEQQTVLIPGVTPLFSGILTSAHNIYRRNKAGIIMDLGSDNSSLLSPKQVVVAAGPTASLKVGDFVEIDIDKFPKKEVKDPHDLKSSWVHIPPIRKIGNTNYLHLQEHQVLWTINK